MNGNNLKAIMSAIIMTQFLKSTTDLELSISEVAKLSVNTTEAILAELKKRT